MSRFMLLALLAAGFLAAPATAQQAGGAVIRGTVRAETGQPLPSVSVAVRDAGGTVVAGRLTGSDGRFRIEGVPAGTYQVQVSLIGHAPARIADVVVSGGDDRDLGEIRLAATAVQVEGVVATVERPGMRVLPDRTVYSTRDMPVAAGGTATDVLRSVPELEVSVEGRLTARGASPQVQINGRPVPIQGEALDAFLQNLPADRIDRVEVVPNPSARYEAEGQGGIVNIVMKEDVDLGLSGSLSVNGGTNAQAGGSGRINYQEGRFTLFGGGSLSRSSRSQNAFDLRENLVSDPVTLIRQDGSSSGDAQFGSLDLTAEVKAGSRGTFWAEGRAFRMGNEQSGITEYMHMRSDLQPTDRYDRDSETEFAVASTSANAGYRHVVRPQRHEYSVELRSSSNRNDNDIVTGRFQRLEDGSREITPSQLTSSLGGEEVDQLSLQADVTLPWTPAGKVEVGYRGSLRETDSAREILNTGAGFPDGRSTLNTFSHREEFHSAYVSGERKFGALGVQLGVRAENAATRFELPTSVDPRYDDRYDDEYASFFPSANISYELAEGRMVRFSYSKRQDRPHSRILNPIDASTDPLNRFIGNPHLKPRYTHSFSAETSWSGSMGTLRLSPYYRRTVDHWDQVKTVDAEGVSTVTWDNIASIEQYGASVSTSLRQMGPLGGFVNLSGYREVRDASNLSTDFSGSSLRWSVNSNLTYRITPRLNAQSQLNYMPSRGIPQGRVSAMVHSSIGLRQQLLNQKASINLSVIDPFGLARYEFETFDQTHRQTGKTTFGMRRAMLSFNYNFGRPPQSTRRRTGQEEMMEPDQTGQIR